MARQVGLVWQGFDLPLRFDETRPRPAASTCLVLLVGIDSHHRLVLDSHFGIIGSFVGFFILFFNNTCYNRWWGEYQKSMSCEGRIFDTAAMCRGCLGRENKYAARILRYANLMHLLVYVGVSPEYNDEFSLLWPRI